MIEGLIARSEMWQYERDIDRTAAVVDGEVVWTVRSCPAVLHSDRLVQGRFQQAVRARRAVRGVLGGRDSVSNYYYSTRATTLTTKVA